ncbi:E3 ubiquitin-protein ligase CHFR-like [Rana temporaria]|uniref:E3 ubiquitin-protein ligase CHFR-like n=1 Tax=Rana temporaria TaxID=8407 RepID=UPI001AADBB57|nr:E3 ubiquitin-protein ligase CHFR-like [Rana temporaria]
MEHFIDRHRAALISRVPLVEPILDHLLQNDLLIEEQYDNVRSRPTSQEKMRQLYQYARGWANPDKDIFYEALKTCNGPLIQDLENSEIVPRAKKPKLQETCTVDGSSPMEHSTKQEEKAKNKGLAPTYLKDALSCLCCVDIFKDPVTLPCGHTYCLACITKTWENQHEREASCPECIRPYLRKPELMRNFRLCELVEAYRLHAEDASHNTE